MSDPARPIPGADDFSAGAMDRPAGARWALAHGVLAATAPEPAARLSAVVSPSARACGAGVKLADYLRIASLRDDLAVRTEDKTIIHRARSAGTAIMTRIVRDGSLALAAGLSAGGLFCVC
jgi:hypothetical protein